MKQSKRTMAALLAASTLFVVACGDDEDSSDPTTAETTAETTGDTTAETTPAETTPPTEPMAEAWAVDTSTCVDEDAANAPIEGTIKIGSVIPLSGGPAASAFSPVKAGFEAYVQYANENGLLGDGLTLEVQIEDDQYNAELTPGAVNTLIESDVDMFAGIIGTADNLAVRDTLNDNCYPQLSALTGAPAWGDVENYPWTTGGLVPYDVEAKVYAGNIAEQFPDGATVALYYVNSEFGQIYVDAFNEIAADYGIDLVGEETVEVTDQAPPTAQITNIAALAPDVIMAVPSGAQCITFLTELANAKAVNAGWDPKVYITNTCASSLILGAAGAAADGLYTSSNGLDLNNPEVKEMPVVADYLAYMDSLGHSDIAITASVGWSLGEAMVKIINQAKDSPEGLTRASIMNAARNFETVGSFAYPGVVTKMSGVEDPYGAESLIVRQYDADTATFADVGELITEFESS